MYFLWNAGEITRTTDKRTEAYIADKHRRIVHAINTTIERLVSNKTLNLVPSTKQFIQAPLVRM
jgi:hypothetical protein